MRIAVDAVSGWKIVVCPLRSRVGKHRPSFRNALTVWLAEPVVPVSLVVNVAVFLWLVQVPAGSPLNSCEYLSSFGLASV